MKTIFATGILLASVSGPAFAGPYANIETNSSKLGHDHQSTVTETHGGYENKIGEDGSYYFQAGPAIVSPSGEDSNVEFSGKVGAAYQVTEKANLYTEYAFLTGDKVSSSFKAGIKYNF
jgi:outer membrane autotransporter protein